MKIVATNVVASRPPERRPTATPTARANILGEGGRGGLWLGYYPKILCFLFSETSPLIIMTCYLPRGGLKFLGGWVVSSQYQTRQLFLFLTARRELDLYSTRKGLFVINFLGSINIFPSISQLFPQNDRLNFFTVVNFYTVVVLRVHFVHLINLWFLKPIFTVSFSDFSRSPHTR